MGAASTAKAAAAIASSRIIILLSACFFSPFPNDPESPLRGDPITLYACVCDYDTVYDRVTVVVEDGLTNAVT
jgi:hypothetical protein